MAKAHITTSTVIDAVWRLRGRGPVGWPTREAIARDLRVDEAVIKPLLSDLKSRRIMDSRRRKGTTVWMPWGEL